VFAARPLAFLPALWPSGLPWKNRALIAWFGPRGLSSLLLVLLPVFDGLPQSEYLLTTCCLVVLFSVVLHGLTPGLLAKAPARVPVSPEGSSAASEVQASSPTVKTDAPPVTSNGHPQPVQMSAEPHSVAEVLSKPGFISVEEVKALRSIPGRAVIIDARSEKSYETSGAVVPGAVRLNPQQAVRSATELGLAKEAVLAVFCACPNDETSARVAGELKKAGWARTRVIEGGWNAWINAGLPVENRFTSK
jgi:NhaP-type Na+/H+ or K+/H+ antiporter